MLVEKIGTFSVLFFLPGDNTAEIWCLFLSVCCFAGLYNKVQSLFLKENKSEICSHVYYLYLLYIDKWVSTIALTIRILPPYCFNKVKQQLIC